MKVLCPTCKKEVSFEGNTFRPFCSERCKLVDLGAWALERYAVPAEDQSPPPSSAAPAQESENDEN